MSWFVLGSVVLFVGVMVWWLVFHTEGVYLGKRVVVWLYDVYATRYDGIVQHDDMDEHLHLGIPMMTRLAPETTPLILDVATGTGRIPLALCQHARFEGHVISLDASQGMLKQAKIKIDDNHFEDYVSLMWGNGENLPFEDNSFDMVTCMEALEFMPDPEKGLSELVRVLRPSGLLLTTRRINESLMPGKLWSQAEMMQKLEHLGMQSIEFEEWQLDYEKVWAVKIGNSDTISAMPFEDIEIRGKWSLNDSGIWQEDR